MSDLVSIIMPSFNTGKYISKSIESVLAQTYPDWELIIVDDYSTDDTEQIVQPYLKDKRIRFIRNEKNCGAAVSRNKALMETKGKWIAFLDSDDLWNPKKLSKQIQFMVEHGYHFSYTNYSEIDCEGNKNGLIVTGPEHITKKGLYIIVGRAV